MFRREVKQLDSLVYQYLRVMGLETPLLQKRLIMSWEKVAGEVVFKYTRQIFISTQTLMVKIDNSALKAELSMMRSEYVRKLNDCVGARVIANIRFF